MTISDLLTLVGILLATIAFISEKNREYILLKLSYRNLVVIAISFIYVHFLLSYEWWKDKIDWISIFEFRGFPTPEGWAYLISITILLWSVWRIFFGEFPLSRRENLMNYYHKLILRNDIAFLAQLVEQFHLKQATEFLRKKKTIRIINPTGIWQIDQEEYQKQYSKVINTKTLIYGNNVYHQVILNNTFLESVANLNPYLFTRIIKELNDLELKEDEFVNKYLKLLILNKNGHFFREIRNNQNLGQYKAYRIEEERPILFSLFSDISVCSINQAWRGIGEQAILEMHEESRKEYSPLRESDEEQDEDTIWSYRITIAIWYFDIMVRQAIKQKVNDHMWMYYYRHFVEVILSNMIDLPFVTSAHNRQSRNFKLLTSIFTKMMDWKEVVLRTRNNSLSKPIYSCIGQCIFELGKTKKLREEDKHYLINWVWEDLIESFGDDDDQNVIIEEFLQYGLEMFRQPSMLFSSNLMYRTEESIAYLNTLRILWDKRDTPKLTGIVKKRANRFKKEVIDNLLV